MNTKIIFTLLLLLTFTITNAQRKKISLSELPENSKAFLAEHFPNTTVKHVSRDPEYGEKGYEVWLHDGTEVEFWKNGEWREVDGHKKPIPTAYIDPKILDYIKTNYPNEKITHVDLGHKYIDVDLTNKIDLDFYQNGNIRK
ncbi:hypothetical protein FCR2A7T_18420 [Flavobacterium cauense R2A-7]|uniref:Putative PepSY-like beta-lactamase-inhibitor n=1 Tax=Flavobacterium cauense R2A-7 TaxID=1341154 RepID=V6S5P6_9FLAO|nr:PepSY-like domain-containing protein [Flavobacterium cauense]ESU19680.1 hypothetical protein FCR2A7T_18420 [Flavobacterium cauense R2A-7]KGO79781.1 hypothetical protein Q762_13445 [Flavobacterium cauense R2A-7]TWI09260.1 putative PepSY-like beta-lactamase-inhibitor [Flavobacterium cauense R2A-7]